MASVSIVSAPHRQSTALSTLAWLNGLPLIARLPKSLQGPGCIGGADAQVSMVVMGVSFCKSSAVEGRRENEKGRGQGDQMREEKKARLDIV